MRVSVVIPVGPGHVHYLDSAISSVTRAWKHSKGPFEDLYFEVVHDLGGKLGRSAARNLGVNRRRADWYFFLDADDEMCPKAFKNLRPEHPATFGAVCLDGRVSKEKVYPLTREMLFTHGAKGTLSMGCFVRGDVARNTLFDEFLDAGEDFDFYMRLPGFVKIREPLVSIGYKRPSAGGPKGYRKIEWHKVCAEVIEKYRPTHAARA